MVIAIGCDIVEHSIPEKLKWDTDQVLLLRIFSQKELDLFHDQKTIQFLSGRFAAKEAVLKCLSTGMQDGISLTNIQVLKLANGKPFIELSGEVKDISDKIGVNVWHISITHSLSYSFAFAVAEH